MDLQPDLAPEREYLLMLTILIMVMTVVMMRISLTTQAMTLGTVMLKKMMDIM